MEPMITTTLRPRLNHIKTQGKSGSMDFYFNILLSLPVFSTVVFSSCFLGCHGHSLFHCLIDYSLTWTSLPLCFIPSVNFCSLSCVNVANRMFFLLFIGLLHCFFIFKNNTELMVDALSTALSNIIFLWTSSWKVFLMMMKSMCLLSFISL